MFAPQPDADKAAKRQRRRFLAKRRSLRALRATLTFIVLVTPFLYFGFLLCCHMPADFRRGLPNLILFYEWWIFLRNIFVLLRNVWFSPLLAALPLAVNLLFIYPYPPGDFRKINRELYFELFRNDRMAVIRQIADGTLPGFDPHKERCALPDDLSHTSFPGGFVTYSQHAKGYAVFFHCGWTVLESYQGFGFNEDPESERNKQKRDDYAYDVIAPQWHYIEY